MSLKAISSLVFYSLVVSCNQSSNIKQVHSDQGKVSFCNILKDSFFVEDYNLIQLNIGGKKIFKYLNKNDSIEFVFDSLNKSLVRINGADTSQCKFEDKRYFLQNSTISIVFLFTENIASQDGEIRYYFDIQKGLLLEQSLSWGNSRFYYPKDSLDKIESAVLLFNILSKKNSQSY